MKKLFALALCLLASCAPMAGTNPDFPVDRSKPWMLFNGKGSLAGDQIYGVSFTSRELQKQSGLALAEAQAQTTTRSFQTFVTYVRSSEMLLVNVILQPQQPIEKSLTFGCILLKNEGSISSLRDDDWVGLGQQELLEKFGSRLSTGNVDGMDPCFFALNTAPVSLGAAERRALSQRLEAKRATLVLQALKTNLERSSR